MALVEYSDSEEELSLPPGKRQKTKPARDSNTSILPPLPAAFRDLYSSTVRTSTQDDPSLHDGRKRVTPHIVGNWPTHIYLESQHNLLCRIVKNVQDTPAIAQNSDQAVNSYKAEVHSLLENELGVALPLHISLSRPLSLKTEQKEPFLHGLRTALNSTYINAFVAHPLDLVWHPNEDRTRWFLVLRLARPPGDGLRSLLKICNHLATEHNQPQLYQEYEQAIRSASRSSMEVQHDNFHASIAWTLSPPDAARVQMDAHVEQAVVLDDNAALSDFDVPCNDVKIRIGQEVSSILLQRPRTGNAG